MEIIGFHERGLANVHGRTVGVIAFVVVTDEGMPEEIVGYCHPHHRAAVIAALRRLEFPVVPAAGEGEPCCSPR